MTRPLRRTRGDMVATGVITALSAVLVATAYFTAPIRASHLSPAEHEIAAAQQIDVAPTVVEERFTLADASPRQRPLVAEGLIITWADKTLTATTPSGETAWTYQRDLDLCALDQAWGKVVATYRGPAGCGDVVAIDALSGTYAKTRSAVAPDQVVGISSNDRIGYFSAQRTEVWRSDLVRTVEYGHVEAPQEDNMQPNECRQTSALTRTDLLSVTEDCDNGTFLRLQKATPEDSRKPELHSSVDIPAGAYLVATGQEAAAIYDPATSTITAYSENGTETASSPVPPLDGAHMVDGSLRVLITADLPHHMTYFEGGTLVLLEPETLKVTTILEEVSGSGFAVENRLIHALPEGLAVVDWDTGVVERIIPVDRGDYTGEVHVDAAGMGIVEKRGDKVVYLSAQ
ncbi:hypothetical protein [Corynebacterium mayonis]|uniref:Rv3212 family protein n=1 Tax=Corynebacterium mayonis TaxID=3062461 RepID=UPI003140B280